MHVVSTRTYVHFFIAGRSRFVRRGTVGMKNTVATFQEMKQKGEKISMLTCYDYSTAKLMDEAGVNSLLIGDSRKRHLGLRRYAFGDHGGHDPPYGSRGAWREECARDRGHALHVLSGFRL